MRRIITTLLTAMLLALSTRQSFADSPPSQTLLSQEALFYRCYSHLVGKRPPQTHPLLLQVKNNSISAIDACMQVLAKANFVPIAESSLTPTQKNLITPANPSVTYAPFTLNDVNDSEAVAVLNKFLNLHRMFFGVRDLSALPAYYWLADRFNDPTEPATYLTRLLFTPNTQYKEVVTGNYAVRAIRSLGAWSRTYYTGGSDVWNLPFAGAGFDRGELWGVGAYAPGNKTWLNDSGNPNSSFQAMYLPNNWTMASERTAGGGIMGLSSYVVMNTGFPSTGRSDDPNYENTRSSVSNGVFRMHRRWAQNVFRDLLCRPLPVLRADDVTNLVANYLQGFPNPANQQPFRTSATCMGCHAALDPMAATIRSLFFYQSDSATWLAPGELTQPGQLANPTAAFVTRPSLWNTYSGIKPPETPANGEYTMMARDSHFYERPGSGDLRYRSYDGSLKWQHFTATGELDGFAQMGQAMAQSNDLYVCAASRYFNYFTGIEVNLQDIGDPKNPPLSADDTYYRDIVIQLGLSLKNHQSLNQLIREIFNLGLYRKKGLRDLVS